MNAPERQPFAVETSHAPSEFERLLDQSYSPRAMLEGDSMDKMLNMAEQMAKSKLSVPEHLRGNVGDCLAIVTQAMLWNMNPFAVAQKTHLVSGKLGYEAQLVNAVLQNSGAVKGLPEYEFKGEGNNIECRVGFVPRGGSAVVWNEFLKISEVSVKNSPLWKSNPKQQLGYLQIKNWARLYVPGAILGVYTEDEYVEQQGAGFNEQNTSVTEPARGPRRKSETAASQADPSTGETTPPPAAETPASPPAATPSNPAKAGGISGGQVAYLRNKIKAAGLEEASFCDRFQVTGIELLTVEQFDTVKAELLAMG